MDLVVTSLPLAIILNPIWAALFLIPFGGSLPLFGVLPLSVMLAVIALQLFNSAVLFAGMRWARRTKASPRVMFRVLFALQLLTSGSWAAGAAACWIDGNGANNTLVGLIMVANMWALALTRSHHPLLFGAGVVPLMLTLWLHALVGTGQAALLFTVLTPIFTAYAWFMGASARERVNQVLRSRFELEDMAAALETARKEAVAKTIEAEAASAQKSAFVANMSHELRTPLNAILGFAELIESDALGLGQVPPQYQAYAGDIRASGAHLLCLINDMLDVAKIEAGKMELDRQDLDAAATVAASVRLVVRRAETKKQSIVVDIDPKARPYADERAFKQIVVNLLSNAVKFSPKGSVIRAACHAMPDGTTWVTVADQGPGIPDDKIAGLFRPFSRIDNRYDSNAGGTGLGLALVRGLAVLHGGRVWLENGAEGGLIARVEFPPCGVTREAA